MSIMDIAFLRCLSGKAKNSVSNGNLSDSTVPPPHRKDDPVLLLRVRDIRLLTTTGVAGSSGMRGRGVATGEVGKRKGQDY